MTILGKTAKSFLTILGKSYLSTLLGFGGKMLNVHYYLGKTKFCYFLTNTMICTTTAFTGLAVKTAKMGDLSIMYVKDLTTLIAGCDFYGALQFSFGETGHLVSSHFT